MKKKSTSKSAFFNLRVLIGLFIGLAGVILALLGFGTFSNASAQANLDSNAQRVGQMKVIQAVQSDLSPPLRDQPVVGPQAGEKREPHVHPRLPLRHHDSPRSGDSKHLLAAVDDDSGYSRSESAVGRRGRGGLWQARCEGSPPDTNGAVGKTQYVQMVNDALQVFDKLTGTSLLGPIQIRSVWLGFGDTCPNHGHGDPIVVYDRLADRWVISHFAQPAGATEPQDECIAVSRTGDATGKWYRYDFHLTGRLRDQDYPKLGVWPDGYYMSAIISTYRSSKISWGEAFCV